MDSSARILVVEDDPNICTFLAAILSSMGYAVVCAKNGKKGLAMAADWGPNVILLDLGLPDIDGMRVLKSIREWSDVPIIVVSAREHELEKVEALDAGADDYITKPFGNNELLARVRTALRLHKKSARPGQEAPGRFTVGELAIDFDRRSVLKAGRSIHLTPIEYKIVTLLAQNAGKVLTHDFIIRQVWGIYGSDDQILRVNMANIRRKLEDNPADPRYILTEVRVGYKMIDAECP